MVENAYWDDSKVEILDIVDDLENNEQTVVPLKCPVCGKSTAHIYMYRWKGDIGTIWAWCSGCKACAHASRRILPSWWEDGDFIHTSELASHPIFLEIKSEAIDTHLKKLLEKKNVNN